ncbi:hypothetical protein [Sanguibacter sp. HDW7]|uniref:hypothetical protein n=1 Tax=Sanguibacter sp. HDW7 TaxID=2714931 RepID=UPI001407339A|nr:hypothetical protein [Sanguibacter sp. HDW7]QIK83118.1 hypothetical protein G7063_05350 [Sanguibacter sp. HDW7]
MSSSWAPPSAQQYPASSTNGVDALIDRLRRLEGIVAEVVKGSPLRQAGLGVAPGQLEVGGNLLVSGSAVFTGDTEIGGSLGVTGSAMFTGDTEVGGSLGVTGSADFSGDTTIGGNLEVTGTLALPSGIIGNDALTSPATFGRGGSGIANIAIPSAAGSLHNLLLPVPANYSQALVMAIATGGAINPMTNTQNFYLGARIGTVTPNTSIAQAEPGKWGNCTAHATRLLTGLSGGTISIDAWGYNSSGTTWAAQSMNRANIDAIAIFLR